MLKLETHLIAHKPRADRHNLLQNLQIVLSQGSACLHDIEDDIAEPKERRDLYRPVKLYDVNVSADGLVVGPGNIGKLCGNSQRALFIVIKILWSRHAHPAFAYSEIQKLI